jgi:hypothetical protein
MTQMSEHYTVSAHESQAVWFVGCLATIPARDEQSGWLCYATSSA